MKLSTLAVTEDLTSGLKENNFAQVSLYPVPANDVLNVSFSNKPAENVKLKVFSIKGDLVKENTMENSNEKISLNVEDLAEGMYLLEISSGQQKMIKKFVKQ